MRFLYLLIFVMLGSDVWPGIIHRTNTSEPLPGVAVSFWAALSLLGGLGIRYPIKMLPVLLLQLVYKAVWLVAVGLPLRSAGRPTTLMTAFVIGLILDLLVIPWPYVFTHYVKMPGDRWR